LFGLVEDDTGCNGRNGRNGCNGAKHATEDISKSPASNWQNALLIEKVHLHLLVLEFALMMVMMVMMTRVIDY
jgi:hypothetical protein